MGSPKGFDGSESWGWDKLIFRRLEFMAWEGGDSHGVSEMGEDLINHLIWMLG